jgi:hypothetical protein
MLKAMKANYLDELDSALWYLYGRIAEQYGQDKAARSAYARVEKPEEPTVYQSSTYRLAALRLIEMNKRDRPAVPGVPKE